MIVGAWRWSVEERYYFGANDLVTIRLADDEFVATWPARPDAMNVAEPQIRIKLRTATLNMLPFVLADAAERENSGTTEATRARWRANAAQSSDAITVSKIATLPAVPRVGQHIYPYRPEA